MSGWMEFQLRFEALDRLESLYVRAPHIISQELARAMRQAVLVVENEVKKRTPRNLGRLMGSISGEVRVAGPHVVGLVSPGTCEYAPYVEYDTKPHFPPVRPLMDWVRQRGLATDPGEVRRIAWAIAFKIARDGTTGAHMFRDGAKAAEPRVKRIFQKALDRALRRIARGGR